MKRIAALGLLLGAALAQPAFLTSLERHPQYQAALAELQARRLSERLAANWVALDARGGWNRSELDEAEPCPFLNDPDPTNDVFCSFISPDLPEEAGQGEVGLTLRPLPFGDYADRVRLRALDRAEGELDFRAARSGLEAAALLAALNAREAEEGLKVALAARELTEATLAVVRVRKQKGAASDRELREAQRRLEDARERVLSAQEALELARAALRSFTDAIPPGPPWFRTPLPEREAAEVVRAYLQLERARVGVANAMRDLYPVAEIGYRRNLDDRHALGASLETRTLSTRLYYAYTSYADPARARTESEWRVGARWNLSLDAWSRSETARLRVRAAQAALEAAKRRAARMSSASSSGKSSRISSGVAPLESCSRMS
jgi:outer membrane protein TolC